MTEERLIDRLRIFAAAGGAAAIILATSGCSQEPTEANAVGTRSLPLGAVLVRDTTITPVGSASYRQYIPTNSSLILTGKTGKYTAWASLLFYSTYFPTRDTAAVYSATLNLHFATWAGDSLGRLSLSMYPIAKSWDASTQTWDSVQTGYYSQSGTPWTFSIGAGPDSQFVSIPLDTAMVRTWLSSSTSAANYGIVFIPNADCSIIRGFTAFSYDSASYQPQLTIIAGSPTGSARDTAVYTLGSNTFVGNADNLTTNPQLLYIQSGVDERASLTFNVPFIPRGAIINSAVLSMVRDPATTVISRFNADTTFVAQAYTSTTRTDLDGYVYAGSRKSTSVDTFAVDIRRPVQLWTKGGNYGLMLAPSTSYDKISFNLMTFYNEQATDSGKRPRLRIIYSTQR